MSDRYSQLVNSPVGRFVAGNVGLPQPAKLERYEPGRPIVDGPVLVGSATGGRLTEAISAVLGEIGAEAQPAEKYKALVYDATGIVESDGLRGLYDFFHPNFRSLLPSGRTIVLGTAPEDCASPRESTAQRALEGFTRSLGKEARAGGTAQLVYVAPGAELEIASTLRFLLSPRSAYVSGQVIRVGKSEAQPPQAFDWVAPLTGKVALVTGASRGIGEAIARTLARDGAHVVGLDIPPQASDLETVVGEIGGSSLTGDITDADAPKFITDQLVDRHGGVDIVVHNAGVTMDKTIVGMDEERWTKLLDINLSSEERINDELLDRKALNENGRIVCVSSISGIAGNAGQSNYATSKAGVIGMARSMAPELAKHKATINAVAPGFIETKMTEAMPITVREAGRRMNSLRQGGLPIDVGETISWFASPASGGLNGNVVRVCGQSLLGA